MSANDLLVFMCQLVFTFLGLLTIADFVRLGGSVRRDIAITFSAVGLPFGLQLAAHVFGPQSQVITAIGTTAILAQPYFILRLSHYFRSVPSSARRAALIAMVLSWAAQLVLPTTDEPLRTVLALLIVAYFASVNLYAMVSFVRGARTSSGVVRHRMRFAAWGIGLLAGAIAVALLSLFEALRPVVQPITIGIVIAAGIAFYLGFATPRPLRRSWQNAELRSYLLRMLTRSAEDYASVEIGLRELCGGAERAISGSASIVLQRSEEERRWIVRVSTLVGRHELDVYDSQSTLAMVWETRKPVSLRADTHLTGADRALLGSAGALMLHIAPISTPARVWGLLLVFQRASSLFADDDLDLVMMFAQQAAVVLENNLLVEQLSRHSDELEHDIALRTRELAETQTQYRQFVETAQEGIWVTDTQNKTIFVNRKMADMLGVSVEDMANKSAYDFLDDEARAVAEQHRKERNAGKSEQYELRFRRADGSPVWTLISATPFVSEDDTVVGSLAMIADITRLKTVETELRQLNAELEQRVADRTRELSNVNRELEAFSYSVSHDLRAPLRGIDGFSQALLEDYGDELHPDAHDMLKRVRAAAQRMAVLIDDMLDLSRISRSEMRMRTFDLSEVASAVVDELRQREPEREITVKIEPGMKVEGDSHLLRIALDNLIGNAWKFTRKTANACIEVRRNVVDGENVYLVRDNGAGFDMAYADKLFGVFQRLHSATDFDGIGIGLATVQRVVSRHGGRVWAEGALQKGATFYFTLGKTNNPKEQFSYANNSVG